jgi:iron-sulfur cluster assembly protein
VLTLTPTAAEVVRQLVASAPVDDVAGGVRISAGETTPAGTALQIAIVEGPEMTDQAVDEEGAHVFLEPRVAEFLDDKVLDAQLDGERVSFAVREQGEFDPSVNGTPPEM